MRGQAEKTRGHLMFAYRTTQRAIRDARWKLIRYPRINRTELFDLKNDPWEKNNQAQNPEHRSRIEKMMKLLAQEQRKLGDDQPLTSANPKSAEFVPPDKKPKTRYPAGGPAPEFHE